MINSIQCKSFLLLRYSDQLSEKHMNITYVHINISYLEASMYVICLLVFKL
jgi:hypothetical protein